MVLGGAFVLFAIFLQCKWLVLQFSADDFLAANDADAVGGGLGEATALEVVSRVGRRIGLYGANSVGHSNDTLAQVDLYVLRRAEIAGALGAVGIGVGTHGLNDVERMLAFGELSSVDVDGDDSTLGEFEVLGVEDVDVEVAREGGVVVVGREDVDGGLFYGSAGSIYIVCVFFLFLVVNPGTYFVVVDVEIGADAADADAGIGELDFEGKLVEIAALVLGNDADEVVVFARIVDVGLLCAGGDAKEQADAECECLLHYDVCSWFVGC